MSKFYFVGLILPIFLIACGKKGPLKPRYPKSACYESALPAQSASYFKAQSLKYVI